MPAALFTLILSIILVNTLLATVIVIYAVRAYWSPFAAKFPPREPSPDAIHRDFQSFRAGLLNLDHCIHVAVDADHLHLRPALFARLVRIQPTSIPWSAITLDRHGSSRRMLRAAIDGHDLRGPRWCLELAEPPS